MIKTFTPHELTLFVYEEASDELSEQIEQALHEDAELRAQYRTLLAAKQSAEKVTYSPSQRSIDSILEYSRAYRPS
jgi:hypothetical protein